VGNAGFAGKEGAKKHLGGLMRLFLFRKSMREEHAFSRCSPIDERHTTHKTICTLENRRKLIHVE
jgi:hypothetical protein